MYASSPDSEGKTPQLIQYLSGQRFNVTTDRFSKKMVDNLTGLVVGAPYLGKPEWLSSPLGNSAIADKVL